MADENTDYSVPGKKVCKLICITGEKNNNKYYSAFEQTDGTFKVVYGRVQSTGNEFSYPMSQWDKKMREKAKKGYQDMTHLHKVVVEESSGKSGVSGTIDIADSAVRDLISKLQSFANKSVQENYTVSSSAVTQAMIDEAQNIINSINKILTLNGDIKEINDHLLRLYSVIPRRMKKVADHLIKSLSDQSSYDEAQKLIATEQAELDVMAGQVAMEASQKKDAEKTIKKDSKKKKSDLLETLGLEVSPVNDKEAEKIKKMMGSNSHQFRRAFKVLNKKTEERYKENLKSAKNKTVELYFHGSRNENWLSILQSGLLIRPSGAVHTGSMWGDGVYGADRCQKSIGYTSSRGSFWAGGRSDIAYLALFEFHVGNQKHYQRHDSSCYNLCKNILQKQNFDSVWAHGGYDLRNDEFIVYDIAQVTIRYIIEFSN